MKNENEPLSSISHLVGFLLAIAALVLMVVFASLKSDVWHIVTFSIFGTSLILLYLASTLFHYFSVSSKVKKVFLRIDHSMIYILIAGTYTPICLIPLRGPWGWTVFGIVWAIALMGVILKSFFINKIKNWVSTFLYVLMGWIIVIAIFPLIESLPKKALFWLVLGGVSYTVGALFYLLDDYIKRTKWFGMHEVFHLFVLFGSFCHFLLMIRYILYL